MNTDGKVVIEASIDVEGFQKELDDIERKLEELRKKQESQKLTLDGDVEVDVNSGAYYGKYQKEYDELIQRQGELNALIIDQMDSEKMAALIKNEQVQSAETIEQAAKSESEAVESEAMAINRLTVQLNEAYDAWRMMQNQNIVSKEDIRDARELKSEIIDIKNQIERISGQKLYIKGINEVHNNVTKVNHSTNNVLKKLTRWGLAIFGIRSAYMGIRQVLNGVLSQNEGLKNQMDGMKQSMYNAFIPIVEKIVNLIRTLMAYINYLWKGLFGKNLFSEKVDKNLKSGAKSAKEIRNQLAGFDEANVLTDNKSSSSGSSGTVTNLKLADVPIPDWLKWIRDFIEKHPTIAKIIFGLAAFTLFGGFKLVGGLLGTITKILGKGAGPGATGLIGINGTLNLLTAAVWLITLDIAGIAYVYDGIKEIMSLQDSRNKRHEKEMENNRETIDSNKKVLASDKSTTEERKKAMDSTEQAIHWERIFSEEKQAGAKNNLKHAETLTYDAMQMLDLYKNGKLNTEEQYRYYKMLKNDLNPTMEKGASWMMKNVEGGKEMREVYDKLDGQFKTRYDIEMKTDFKSITSSFNEFMGNIRKAFDKPIKLKVETQIENITEKLKKVFHADGGISTGIVNLPGRGVPIDIAGERGREGFIPIDNQSAMTLLGQEIAKYVNIKNIVNNYMDARQLNSILQQSASNEKLANNG